MRGSHLRKERDRYAQDKLYLPDGTFILYDEEWNNCFDLYFSENYTKKMSIQDMLHYSLQSLDIAQRKIVASSILVTGGATSVQGFSKKLSEEYEALQGRKVKVMIGDKVDYRFKDVREKTIGAWIGGALMSRTAIASKLRITKQEYEEKGDTAIVQKYLL